MCCSVCCTADDYNEEYENLKKTTMSLLREMDDAADSGTLPDSFDEFRRDLAIQLGLYKMPLRFR